MIPGVDKQFVDGLRAWINSAPEEDEREAREKGAFELLFDGASEEEVERIKALLAEPEAKEGETPVPEQKLPEEERKPRRKWGHIKLYDPARKEYSRSTREEGLGEEMKNLRGEARGTPFFGGGEGRSITSLSSIYREREQHERLLDLLRGKPSAKGR